MVPTIDGESRDRVREFLNAANYAMKNIHPGWINPWISKRFWKPYFAPNLRERQW